MRTRARICGGGGLALWLVACGGRLDAEATGQDEDGSLSRMPSAEPPSGAQSAGPRGAQPAPPSVSPDVEPPVLPPVSTLPASGPPRSSSTDTSCVSLPVLPARNPALTFADSCARSEFVPLPPAMTGHGDARAKLVGRWQLCGADERYGQLLHSGIEFSGNGRNRLLRLEDGVLRPVRGAPTDVYVLLESGQFMQRGELSFGEYAAFAHFDTTESALLLELPEQGRSLRYARVLPDLSSALSNTFATTSQGCSMVGVWDTDPSSSNPAAAFAFNAEGEWFGGDWGSDLCAGHSMYGTYQLIDRQAGGGDISPYTSSEFELVTNVGAGRCEFWFGAGFSPEFSADCMQLTLRQSWDNCTGGRGYLNYGEVLLRR